MAPASEALVCVALVMVAASGTLVYVALVTVPASGSAVYAALVTSPASEYVVYVAMSSAVHAYFQRHTQQHLSHRALQYAECHNRSSYIEPPRTVHT